MSLYIWNRVGLLSPSFHNIIIIMLNFIPQLHSAVNFYNILKAAWATSKIPVSHHDTQPASTVLVQSLSGGDSVLEIV